MAEGLARWQVVVGVVGLIVVVVLGVLLFAGGGHGPGRHAPTGGTAPSPAETAVTPSAGHVPPTGGHG